MQPVAFHTTGSNLIRVDLYSDTPRDTLVELQVNSIVFDYIKVPSTYFVEGKALVIFNSLDREAEEYRVKATDSSGSSTCNITIEQGVETDVDNLIQDDLMSRSHRPPTDIEGNMELNQEISGEIFVADFTSQNIIKIGEAEITYQGGGNRYLTQKDTYLIVNQEENAVSINDKFSPLQLNSYFRIEDANENIWNNTFSIHASGTYSIRKEEIQKGMLADVYTANKSNGIDEVFGVTSDSIAINGLCTVSAIVKANNGKRLKISILDANSIVLASNTYTEFSDYIMAQASVTYTGNVKVDISVEVINKTTSLYIFHPQVEAYPIATSRMTGEREEDSLRINVYGANIVSSAGGYVEIKFVSGRSSSVGHCLLDWRNNEDQGLLIYQDNLNRFVANITVEDSISVTSTPIILEEGVEYTVTANWTETNLSIDINGQTFNAIGNVESFTSSEMRVGSSADFYSLCGDLLGLKLGK